MYTSVLQRLQWVWHWAMLTHYMLLEHTCWVLVLHPFIYYSRPVFTPSLRPSLSPSPSAPSPMLYKPNPVSWQCGERAVGLCLCLCSLGFLFFFFFTECFSRAEIVWVVPALPHPSDHASAWCYVPSDLRRSLTHSSIHWLLLLWLFITNTTAKARSMAVYAFKS